MRQIFRAGLVGLSLTVLVSCGGVSGTSNSEPDPNLPGGVNIVLGNNAFKLTAIQGLDTFISTTMDVTSTLPHNDRFVLQAADNDHLLKQLQLGITGLGSSDIEMEVSPNLTPGTYKGTVTIQAVCIAGCDRVISSVDITLQVTVQPATNLTPLTTLSGATDFQTALGGNAHDNYEPVTLDASKFNSRWIKLLSPTLDGLGDDFSDSFAALTDSGHHLAATPTGAGYDIYDEANGAKLWSFAPSDVSDVEAALYNGVLYTTDRSLTADAVDVAAFADDTGVSQFATTVACTVGCSAAQPIVAGGDLIVVPSDLATPITALDAATGAPAWTGAVTTQRAVAADASDVYFYVPNAVSPGATGVPGFTALDFSGNLLWQIPRAADLTKFRVESLQGSVPSLDSHGGALVRLNVGTDGGGPLERYDLSTHHLIWAQALNLLPAAEASADDIAVAGDVVYVSAKRSGSGVLEALDLATGAVKWSLPAPDGGIGPLLLTKNLLFFGGESATYAVDLTTHAIVWIHPLPARGLSMSANGVLYIVGDDKLAAVNLH